MHLEWYVLSLGKLRKKELFKSFSLFCGLHEYPWLRNAALDCKVQEGTFLCYLPL